MPTHWTDLSGRRENTSICHERQVPTLFFFMAFVKNFSNFLCRAAWFFCVLVRNKKDARYSVVPNGTASRLSRHTA